MHAGLRCSSAAHGKSSRSLRPSTPLPKARRFFWQICRGLYACKHRVSNEGPMRTFDSLAEDVPLRIACNGPSFEPTPRPHPFITVMTGFYDRREHEKGQDLGNGRNTGGVGWGGRREQCWRVIYTIINLSEPNGLRGNRSSFAGLRSQSGCGRSLGSLPDRSEWKTEEAHIANSPSSTLRSGRTISWALKQFKTTFGY